MLKLSPARWQFAEQGGRQVAAAGKVAVPHRGRRRHVGLQEVVDEQVGQQKAAAGKAVLSPRWR